MIKWIECIQRIWHLSQNNLHSVKEMVDYLKTDIDGVRSVILPNLQNILEHKFQDNSYIYCTSAGKNTFSPGFSPEILLTLTLWLQHEVYPTWRGTAASLSCFVLLWFLWLLFYFVLLWFLMLTLIFLGPLHLTEWINIWPSLSNT